MENLHTIEKITNAAANLIDGATPVPADAPAAATFDARVQNFEHRIRHVGSGAAIVKTEMLDGKLVFTVYVPRYFSVTEDGDAVEIGAG